MRRELMGLMGVMGLMGLMGLMGYFKKMPIGSIPLGDD